MDEVKNNGVPNSEDLTETLDRIAYTLDKAYISRLKDDYDVISFDEYIKKLVDFAMKIIFALCV